MRKLWIDTDGGSDDAVAIMMAMLDKDTEVLGISTVVGNTPIKQVNSNVLWSLEQCCIHTGCDIVDVYSGCSQPLLGPKTRHAFETHGNDGLGDLGFSPSACLEVQSQFGPQSIVNMLLDNEVNTIDIIALGPLTNLAVAMHINRDVLSRAKSITIMGSAGLGIGNVTPLAEFNIWYDAEAAKLLLDSTIDVNLTFVGWDACLYDAIFSEGDCKHFRSLSELGRLAIDCNQSLVNLNLERFKIACIDFADPVAMATVLWPSCIKYRERYHCDIDTLPGLGYGAFIIDRHHDFEGTPNATVISKIHADIYKTKMKKLFRL